MKSLELVINIVLIIASIIMIIVVMLQKSKSQGLGSAFGGEAPSLSNKTKSASKDIVLQRVTVVMGVIIAVLAIGLAVVSQFA